MYLDEFDKGYLLLELNLENEKHLEILKHKETLFVDEDLIRDGIVLKKGEYTFNKYIGDNGGYSILAEKILNYMKGIYLVFFLLTSILLHAQNSQPCNLTQSNFNDIPAIAYNDVICLAKNSDKKFSLFFTFGIWCEPCRLHLPGAIKFAEQHNLDFYVILLEPEDNIKAKQAASYLRYTKPDIKTLILKDEVYGTKRTKKNKKFVTEITPKNSEAIDDYSKYILLNNKGDVLRVTNWKDGKDEVDWKDDSKMLDRILVPLVTN